MDSLKSLLEKKQYDLVISLCEKSDKPSDIFYLIAAYLAQGESAQAQAIFFQNRDRLYESNPRLTMKTNFELRDILKQYDEAYEDLAYFENKPYVSQEVEEDLRDLPKRIRMMEKNSSLSAGMSPEKIEDTLRNSTDDYTVLTLLSSLEGPRVLEHLEAVKALLVSPRHGEVKTYALLLLISAHYSSPVTFRKNGQSFSLIPSAMTPPFSGPIFSAFREYLQKLAGDPSVFAVAENLLNEYILELYPLEAVRESEDPLLALALLKLARSYLRNDEDLKETYARYGLSAPAVEALAEKITEVLEANPPLAI